MMRLNTKCLLFAFGMLVALIGSALSQTPSSTVPPSRDTFDVVSVKPHDPTLPAMGFRGSARGTLVLSGMSLKQLIETAYFLRDYQIIGAPKWTSSALYDISAKDSSAVAASNTDLTDEERKVIDESIWPRLQLLLKDRFQLVAHKETRSSVTHALVVSKPGQLRGVDCSPKGGYFLRPGVAKGPMRLSSLAAVLSQQLNTPVADKTNLPGCYNIDLTWTVDPSPTEEPDAAAPSIATALQSAGLKMVSEKGSVEVLVIDHVERPDAN